MNISVVEMLNLQTGVACYLTLAA